MIVLLQTNDALVAPLLRLKENYCHVEECERVLMKSKKYNELVILYQTKGLHKKGIFRLWCGAGYWTLQLDVEATEIIT